jgi:transcriptional repressor NrdR
MNCPCCNNDETKVLDSRISLEGHGVRRRRKCSECDFRFSTLEEARILDLMIVKRDGATQAYKREKILTGLEMALRKRSYTSEEFSKLVRDIEFSLQALKKSEVTSSQLGEIVMDNLRDFDKVGYIRFASVYRQFEDVKTFEDEINKLNK